MANMKNIKRRIGSVSSTRQIMKAMNLVASSRLQRAKSQVNNVRPMYNKATDLLEKIKRLEQLKNSEYVARERIKNRAYILLTSDRGLCGGYNVNACKLALEKIREHNDSEPIVIAMGARGFDYLKRNGIEPKHKYPSASDGADFEIARKIGAQILEMYKSGEVDEIFVIFTHFESILSHVPQVLKLLPIEPIKGENSEHPLFEPNPLEFINSAIPLCVNTLIYGAMMESSVCEQAARMTSMDSASRNASEIIDGLTLEFNRMRQGLITQEITEIVGGATALE